MYLETYVLIITEIKPQKNLMFFIFGIESPLSFFMSLTWMESFKSGSSNFRVELQGRGCVHDNHLLLLIKVFFPLSFVWVTLQRWRFETEPRRAEPILQWEMYPTRSLRLQILRRKLSGEEEKGDIMKGVAGCLSLPAFVRGFVSLAG